MRVQLVWVVAIASADCAHDAWRVTILQNQWKGEGTSVHRNEETMTINAENFIRGCGGCFLQMMLPAHLGLSNINLLPLARGRTWQSQCEDLAHINIKLLPLARGRTCQSFDALAQSSNARFAIADPAFVVFQLEIEQAAGRFAFFDNLQNIARFDIKP